MSDKDWYTEQGIHFQYKSVEQYQQPTAPIDSEINTVEYVNTVRKGEIYSSEDSQFGYKTTFGITIICITLAIQFLILIVTNSSDNSSQLLTEEDFEEALEDAQSTADFLFTMSIVIIILQIIGLIMIAMDVSILSDYLQNESKIKNNNMDTILERFNKSK